MNLINKIRTDFLVNRAPLQRNIFHLFAATSAAVMFIFWVATGLAAEDGFDVRVHNGGFATWIFFLVLIWIVNIVCGILQILSDSDKSHRFAGVLTILVSPLFFPIFVSLTYYLHSGLTIKKQHQEIKSHVIENFDAFLYALNADKKELSLELKDKIEFIVSLQKKNIIDKYNGNSFALSLIEKEISIDSWPLIWDNEKIINDVYGIVSTKKDKNWVE